MFTMETYGWTSTGSGLVFLALTIPSFSSILLGKYTSRHQNTRLVIALELLLSIFPMAALRFTELNTMNSQILFVCLLVFVGFFMTTTQALVMGEVSAAVREIEAECGIESGISSGMGTGFALCNMAMATGQFVGPLIAGLAKIGLGWGNMTLILGGMTSSVGLVSLLFL